MSRADPLRALYGAIVAEPVPARLLELVDALENNGPPTRVGQVPAAERATAGGQVVAL